MRLLFILLTLILSINMLAQKQSTFVYELTLFESYKHRSMWTDREHNIQQEHVAYLDSLEREGKLLIAGIIDQNLENHSGFVMLQTEDYQEAFELVQQDPSIKEGMMSAKLRPINIYFKYEE
ncbi:MAG: YciI family protein [Cytophagales bacterium]|nr:YciI family protein [Cytophagales bacterium]